MKPTNQAVEQELTVRDLMHDRTWNVEVQLQIVVSADTSHNLPIPIPTDGPPDRILWPHKDDGRITAKSVYHQLQENLSFRPK